MRFKVSNFHLKFFVGVWKLLRGRLLHLDLFLQLGLACLVVFDLDVDFFKLGGTFHKADVLGVNGLDFLLKFFLLDLLILQGRGESFNPLP